MFGKTKLALCASILVLWLTTAAMAEDAKGMTIGDKAPAIDIAHWLKSPEVPGSRGRAYQQFTDFEEGKVYVLEFWATWCGPCKAGMPHLGELQEKFADKGVTILGISDEPLQTVSKFLARKERSDDIWYDRIHYWLATDPDESVKNDYFKAAGQTGIPCAFIVGKDGHVEWIGHPMTMDEPLAAVVEDRWNRDTYRAQWEQQEEFERLQREMRGQMTAALRAKDWTRALGLIDEQLAEFPDNLGLKRRRYDLLLYAGQAETAQPLGQALVQAYWSDAQQLNSLAWMIVDDENVQSRDLALAMKAAERANELTESKDGAILDTLARVFYEQGDLAKAIEWQQKAVEHAGEGQMGDGIRKTLEQYQEEHQKREKAPGEFY